jgi:hypothetical protein
MLKKNSILITFIISAILALLEFYFFIFFGPIFFKLHHIFGVFIGFLILICSSNLLKNKKYYSTYIMLIIGVSIIIIHIIKYFFAVCI